MRARSSRSIADPSPRSILGIADASVAADGDIIARATTIFRVLVWPAPHLLAGDEAQPVKRERQTDWNRLKALALSLGLPGVEETTSWGQPTLKAHGKLWVWWSPHEDAPVFKVPFEEREVLVEAEPETLLFHAALQEPSAGPRPAGEARP